MKAKIRETGEIVEVISYHTKYGTSRHIDDKIDYIDSEGIKHTKVPLNYFWDLEIIGEHFEYDKMMNDTYSKCIRLDKSCVAVVGGNQESVQLEFTIETETETPLALHKRNGCETITAIKLSKDAAKALSILLVDYLKHK